MSRVLQLGRATGDNVDWKNWRRGRLVLSVCGEEFRGTGHDERRTAVDKYVLLAQADWRY